MSHLFPFEKLEVLHDAKALVIKIYAATKDFPLNEQFGLTSQIKRAAISVASNLAEGGGRTSYKDQAHFSQIAYGSLMEVTCQLVIAQDLGFLHPEACSLLRQEIVVISKKLSALRNSQLKRAE